MDKKEQARLRMQRMRNKQRNKGEESVTQTPESVTQTPDSVTQTPESVTQTPDSVTQDVTQDGTYFKDGVEMVPPLGTLPERPRFLILSDGQVLDRAYPPKMIKRLTREEVGSWKAIARADTAIIRERPMVALSEPT